MNPVQRQIRIPIADDPIRFIAGRAFMISLSLQARIKCTGYQLEHYFEPNKIVENQSTGLIIRSCKYDRYLQMKSFPSRNTLLAIERKIPTASQFLTQEIWQSLICNPPDSAYWMQFYQNLRPGLQRHVFRMKPSSDQNFEQKKMRYLTINAIYREGDQQALACLIALMRQARASEHYLVYDMIETAVYNLIFFVLSYEPYYSVRNEIINYVKSQIVENDINCRIRESPWTITEADVDTICGINRKNILLAEDLGLATTNKEMIELFYWKHHGNKHLIVKEMAQACRVQKYELPDSDRGLKWLITNINKSRSPTNKIPTDIL